VIESQCHAVRVDDRHYTLPVHFPARTPCSILSGTKISLLDRPCAPFARRGGILSEGSPRRRVSECSITFLSPVRSVLFKESWCGSFVRCQFDSSSPPSKLTQPIYRILCPPIVTQREIRLDSWPLPSQVRTCITPGDSYISPSTQGQTRSSAMRHRPALAVWSDK